MASQLDTMEEGLHCLNIVTDRNLHPKLPAISTYYDDTTNLDSLPKGPEVICLSESRTM